MALTDKKRRFADALLSGASKSQAAIDAGYSVKTAPQAGSKLFKDPDVATYMHRCTALGSDQPKVKSEVKKVNPEESPADDQPLFDSRALLERIARDNEKLNPELAAKIALGLMPYDHAKKGEKGKKEQVQEAAEQVASGRFGLRRPGQLRAVK
ncbi:terminase small subunit [Pseudomonas capeferrum]|uniref:terminase small subunit n=1 Tax=Pseudomonas capeferrum TaxID=1495066 RepID=UPI0015E3EA8A|nr:terminase small subunit [Pseudomonas capeferrum]MBA1200464.1 terminase small subunit [Pseudomonas capeferrum]